MVDLIDAVEADRREPTLAPSRLSRLVRSRPRDWREWTAYAPLLLVGFAVVFGLWLLRVELRAVPYPNDASTHASFVRFAEQRIRAGHSPFDAWYPYLQLGTPQFLQYQALSHILTGALSIVFGDSLFRWLNYLLMCTWPITVYIGARLLDLDRWQAGAAALFSPMLVNVVGYGYEWASFVWLGSGMWSMLWALWLMPIAVGLAWRAIAHGERFALATFVVGLTCALHFVTGYFVLSCIGVFVLVRPPAALKRLARGAAVGVGGLVMFAFVFVPTIGGLRYVLVDQFQAGTFWVNSYGPGKVFSWLFHGKIFDSGRHPIVSLFVALGALVCLWRARRDESARVPLGLMALALALYSGRSVVGPVIDRLPGGSDLLLHRYIIAVHFSGMLLGGIGAVWAFRLVANVGQRVIKVPGRAAIAVGITAVLALVVMWPVLNNRVKYADSDKTFIASQQIEDKTEVSYVNSLINIAKQRGGGRIYAGAADNWGAYIKAGQVQLLELPLQQDADSIGFTLRMWSLSADIEPEFNDSNAAQYDLFDVKYVILPPGRQPSVAATEIIQIQGYSLWQVNTTGYLEVVDGTDPIPANNKDTLKVFGPYLQSTALAQDRHPLVAFDGHTSAVPSLSALAPYTGPPGSVITSSDSLDNGTFSGTVTASRPAYVMLKESYAPHWTATVDGQPVKTAMIAPSFVAVPVPQGTHKVVFQYRSQKGYPELFTLGGLTLLGFVFGPSAWRRYRRRGAGGAPDPEPDPAPDGAEAEHAGVA